MSDSLDGWRLGATTGTGAERNRATLGRILVVDDTESSLHLLARLLERDGHVVIPTTDSASAVRLVHEHRPDLVFLDVMMPSPDGFEVCRALKRDTATVLMPVVLVTALRDATAKLRGLDAGADDFLTKPVNPAELHARVRSLLRLKRYTDDLDSAEAIILSLALTIEARDTCTNGHCQRLAVYAVALGRAMGANDEEVASLRLGGFLHDVGKIGIPDAILLKPGRLTASEYDVMRQHTVIGDRLCGELRSLKPVRAIVRHHHERLDGSGYPDRLRGDGIPPLAQIIGVVDVFDALTVARPYRLPLPPVVALDELRREVSAGWKRADLVDAFVEVIAQHPLSPVTTLPENRL